MNDRNNPKRSRNALVTGVMVVLMVSMGFAGLLYVSAPAKAYKLYSPGFWQGMVPGWNTILPTNDSTHIRAVLTIPWDHNTSAGASKWHFGLDDLGVQPAGNYRSREFIGFTEDSSGNFLPYWQQVRVHSDSLQDCNAINTTIGSEYGTGNVSLPRGQALTFDMAFSGYGGGKNITYTVFDSAFNVVWQYTNHSVESAFFIGPQGTFWYLCGAYSSTVGAANIAEVVVNPGNLQRANGNAVVAPPYTFKAENVTILDPGRGGWYEDTHAWINAWWNWSAGSTNAPYVPVASWNYTHAGMVVFIYNNPFWASFNAQSSVSIQHSLLGFAYGNVSTFFDGHRNLALTGNVSIWVSWVGSGISSAACSTGCTTTNGFVDTNYIVTVFTTATTGSSNWLRVEVVNNPPGSGGKYWATETTIQVVVT